MSLVFAAITPHSPLLIPAIGKDNLKKLSKTKQALERLEEDLYLSHPDTILIISSHGHILPDAFSINFCTDYESDLREFGDLTTKLKLKGEVTLPSKIRAASKKNGYPAVIVSERALDHGVVVPLFYLTRHLPDTTILPLHFSNLDWKTHLDFGYLVKDQIMHSNKRVAVIASGDLSHALTTDAPAGFNPAGAEFDQKIQELLSTGNSTGLLRLSPELVNNAAECGLRSFLILMGILRGVHYNYESYAYESPFGVGHLTANLAL
ncbi:MAG: AmmeMemoRadiSam system protein B [Candidatus Magasanikbacteria bacterium RIFCSPHIGHO2_01_FULL_47_8]|uniref:AmmeMemoRadiSam system protein B n=1 Tax=Candidatus Magasanikbacteria bacterium RIFCSPHIGHO2_01_FULL_47_8 TaxID=1798673 RepID=A0A1F6ME02_9BACT|nr:MAG: AmmeMemoRadiSam system protein B [Candidatus Magasanikbacteria bacterium RIFCSPHIGHO2_01_FULL_47_8]